MKYNDIARLIGENFFKYSYIINPELITDFGRSYLLEDYVIDNGIAICTTSTPHGFQNNQNIFISNAFNPIPMLEMDFNVGRIKIITEKPHQLNKRDNKFLIQSNSNELMNGFFDIAEIVDNITVYIKTPEGIQQQIINNTFAQPINLGVFYQNDSNNHNGLHAIEVLSSTTFSFPLKYPSQSNFVTYKPFGSSYNDFPLLFEVPVYKTISVARFEQKLSALTKNSIHIVFDEIVSESKGFAIDDYETFTSGTFDRDDKVSFSIFVCYDLTQIPANGNFDDQYIIAEKCIFDLRCVFAKCFETETIETTLGSARIYFKNASLYNTTRYGNLYVYEYQFFAHIRRGEEVLKQLDNGTEFQDFSIFFTPTNLQALEQKILQ